MLNGDIHKEKRRNQNEHPDKQRLRRRCPDISKLSALGYTPKISLQDGLPRLANWYNSHSEPPNTVKMER